MELNTDRYLVVNTVTEEVLSKWDTLEKAEKAMLKLPPWVGGRTWESYPYAVADDTTDWRRKTKEPPAHGDECMCPGCVLPRLSYIQRPSWW